MPQKKKISRKRISIAEMQQIARRNLGQFSRYNDSSFSQFNRDINMKIISVKINICPQKYRSVHRKIPPHPQNASAEDIAWGFFCCCCCLVILPELNDFLPATRLLICTQGNPPNWGKSKSHKGTKKCYDKFLALNYFLHLARSQSQPNFFTCDQKSSGLIRILY